MTGKIRFMVAAGVLAAAGCLGAGPARDASNPAIAPPWSLEPWVWEDDVNTQQAVGDLINGYRKHDLPIGAVLIDSPWSTAYNNFVFDESRYPRPAAMIDTWHKMGIRTVLWMTHIIDTAKDKSDAPGSAEDLYDIGRQRGYFVNDGQAIRWWKGAGGMIDFTNPEAVAWWHRLMDRALALGVDGWKVDGAAELFALTQRKTSQGVIDTREYLDLYYRDVFHYGRQWKPEFATMVRSVDIANSMGNDGPHAPFDAAPLTWVGDQRHSWTGKGINEAARSFFRALDLGYPLVSSDTGGYQTDPANKKTMPRLLFLRWAQWNALTPFFQNGGHDEHRPWMFDAEFLRTFRRYMWLHHELVPFFYSQSVAAHLREGRLMRRGPGANEFLLGDALLVGVMLDEKPEREMVFPDGEWLDYWDNAKTYRGGETVTVAVPEDRSPVFVKRGAIIPMNVENDACGHDDVKSRGWLTLDVYPASHPTQAVIWDTASFPPRAGRDRTLVECVPAAKGISVKVTGGPARDIIVRVHRDGRVRVARVRRAVNMSVEVPR
jgi:alpha-glucosidase (family GH31 glycosyl hydrolase)